MKERPILFSGAMVRAVLDDRKTQTRRVVKADVDWIAGTGDERDDPDNWGIGTEDGCWVVLNQDRPPWTGSGQSCESYRYTCPYGSVGDRLWVRETWAANVPGCEFQGGYSYRADHRDLRGDGPAHPMKWRPSIYMPRLASRITLEVTGVRVERLQDIGAEDAIAEGIDPDPYRCPCEFCLRSGVLCTASQSSVIMDGIAPLWDSINGKRAGCSWTENPFVWVIAFRKLETDHA